MTIAVAVSTVAVVVRQLIRGNAIAHVVFVSQKAPQREAEKMCVDICHTTARRRWDRAPK